MTDVDLTPVVVPPGGWLVLRWTGGHLTAQQSHDLRTYLTARLGDDVKFVLVDKSWEVHVLAAADERIAAALQLHFRICDRCGEQVCECSPTAPGRERWTCHECDTPGQTWPCPTARALGAEA